MFNDKKYEHNENCRNGFCFCDKRYQFIAPKPIHVNGGFYVDEYSEIYLLKNKINELIEQVNKLNGIKEVKKNPNEIEKLI